MILKLRKAGKTSSEQNVCLWFCVTRHPAMQAVFGRKLTNEVRWSNEKEWTLMISSYKDLYGKKNTELVLWQGEKGIQWTSEWPCTHIIFIIMEIKRFFSETCDLEASLRIMVKGKQLHNPLIWLFQGHLFKNNYLWTKFKHKYKINQACTI